MPFRKELLLSIEQFNLSPLKHVWCVIKTLYVTFAARRFIQGDERFVTEQRFSVAQLHGRHHSGHVPGRKKLPPVFVTQLQLHKDTPQEVPGRVTQPVNNVGQQLCHVRDVLLFVSTDYTQILLLPGFTEAKPVFQRDDAAADEVFEHFKPVMIPGRLTEQLNKGFFVVNHARHASSP